METTPRQSSLFDPLPKLGQIVTSGSLYVCLYDTGHLSVLISRKGKGTQRLAFEDVYRGVAPDDMATALPCLLWVGAQMADDIHHAPF